MDLIHPRTVADVAEALGAASRDGIRVLVVGGRRHLDKGEPDARSTRRCGPPSSIRWWPTSRTRCSSSSRRACGCGTLAELLAEHGQEWPADAPPDATVGGVIASGSTSARRLRVGALRDTVVEMELVTGDGRTVHSGARTVKNVTGYDLHRLMTGSLGTLGVITQVALKVRPLPERRRTLVAVGDLALARRIAAEVPLVAGVLGTQDGLEVRLEGWSDEIEELAAAVVTLAGDAVPSDDDTTFPRNPWWSWPDRGTVLEAAVVPSSLPRYLRGQRPTRRWRASASRGSRRCRRGARRRRRRSRRSGASRRRSAARGPRAARPPPRRAPPVEGLVRPGRHLGAGTRLAPRAGSGYTNRRSLAHRVSS